MSGPTGRVALGVLNSAAQVNRALDRGPLVFSQWLFLIRRTTLLWTIFVVLLVLWLLGLVSSYTLGGYIHLLLVLAIVVLLIRVIQGRRPVV